MSTDKLQVAYDLSTELFDAVSPSPDNASDIYLKLEGIDGEVTDPAHKGEIEVANFDFYEWQLGSSGKGGGSGASRPTLSDIFLRCPASKASPKLFLYCCKGERIPSAVISFRKTGGGPQVFLTWKLTTVVVKEFLQGPAEQSDGSVALFDVITLGYAKINVEYKPQNKDGSLGSPLSFAHEVTKK